MKQSDHLKSVFDIVYVTSPSSNQTDVYQTLCNSIKNSIQFFSDTTFRCISDPFDIRVGNGGGTLNVVDDFVNSERYETVAFRMLIIHSGGDSRRSPLHSVCGKAWATLSSSSELNTFANPVLYALLEISKLCVNLPPFSIVVGCSDILLDITRNGCGVTSFPMDSVSIITVEEIPEISKNHGVLVKTTTSTSLNKDGIYTLSPVKSYLQKPSIEKMIEEGAIQSGPNQFAMIDTGVVIFTGKATQAMIDLTRDPVVKLCTYHGLKSEYVHPETMSMAALMSSSVRIELYSEILYSAMTESGPCTLDQLYQSLGTKSPGSDSDPSQLPLYDRALRSIWNAMKSIPFYMIDVHEGVFGHLGTSAEFLDLVTSCQEPVELITIAPSAAAAPAATANDHQEKNALFAKKNHFENQVLSYVSPSAATALTSIVPESLVGAVLVNSWICSLNRQHQQLDSTCGFELHSSSFIEHTVFLLSSISDGRCVVGHRCILSHLTPSLSERLQRVCDEVMLQQIPLISPGHDDHNEDKVGTYPMTLLVLGLKDDVKAPYKSSKATICGQQWKTLFEISSLTADDVWSSTVSDSDRTLWTAKLFPITHDLKIEHTAIWLQYLNLHTTVTVTATEAVAGVRELFAVSLAHWRSVPLDQRLSLSEILTRGDALSMHAWRVFLTSSLPSLRSTFDQNAIACINSNDISSGIGSDGDGVAGEELKSIDSLPHLVECIHIVCFNSIKRLRTKLTRKYLDSFLNSVDTTVVSSADCASFLLLGSWLHFLCLRSQCFHTSMPSVAIIAQNITKMFPKMLSFYFNTHRDTPPLSYTDDDTAAVATAGWAGIQALVSRFMDWNKRYAHEAHHKDVVIATYFVNFLETSTRLRLIAYLLSLVSVETGVFATEESACVLPIETHPRVFLQCAWLARSTLITITSSKLDDIQKLCSSRLYEKNEQLNCRGFAAQAAIEFAAFIKETMCESSIQTTAAFIPLSDAFECFAQRFVDVHVQSSLMTDEGRNVDISCHSPKPHIVFVSEASGRVDITGGWSDTPPICYESQGAVLNVAVSVDGVKPIRCASRFVDAPKIILRSLSSVDNFCTYEGESLECTSFDDFRDVADSSKPCALLKAVLVVLGVVPAAGTAEETFSDRLIRLFGGRGIEVACVSLLPAGSGMGGSSIIAAAVLQSVSSLLKLPMTRDILTYQVLRVEQTLTTGGGWQDQIGAIYGGFKLGKSSSSLPLRITVDELSSLLSQEFVELFESRVVLVFTGQQRLAKNTLINALRKFALTDCGVESKCITSQLVSEAMTLTEYLHRHAAAAVTTSHEAKSESHHLAVDRLGAALTMYWRLKRSMAEGSEPVHITQLLALLQPLTAGMSLCGAGAGGYLVAVINRTHSYDDICKAVQGYQQSYTQHSAVLVDMSVHRVRVDTEGVATVEKPNDSTSDIAAYLF